MAGLPYPQLMADLCEKDGGWKISQTVDNVRGYYLDGDLPSGGRRGCGHLNSTNFCIDALLSGAFSYVEVRVDTVDQFSDQKMVDAPGLYKFTIQKSGHPDCRIFQGAVKWWTKDSFSEEQFYQGPRAKLRDHCVATTPISKLESEYQIFTKREDLQENTNGKLVVEAVVVSKISTPDVLAEYKSYRFIPGPTWHTQFRQACPRAKQEPDGGIQPYSGIRDILRPIT